jgi:hypothetical protein
MKETEILAAETLLENGVSLGIDSPLFFRVLGVKRLKIYQPSLGNRIRISKLYLEMGITDEMLVETTQVDAEDLLQKNALRCCRIIALCMFRGRYLPILLNSIIANWLIHRMDSKQVMTLIQVIVSLSGTVDFMNTTRYIRALKITSPKLGQEAQTS